MAHYSPGRYRCKIVEQGFSESREKKTPCFAIKVKVIGLVDQTNGDLLPCDSYERTVTLWLTDNTIENAIRNVRSLGFDGASFRELDPEVPGHTTLVGTEADFLCDHEDYNGKAMERWEFPPPEARHLERVSGLSKKLDALFGKSLKAAAGPKATVAKSKQEGAAAPAGPSEKDEIPF